MEISVNIETLVKTTVSKFLTDTGSININITKNLPNTQIEHVRTSRSRILDQFLENYKKTIMLLSSVEISWLNTSLLLAY